MTKNQRDYRKEVKRLKRFMKNAEKRGFFWQTDELPLSIPKRVTQKSLKEIKRLTPERMYAKGRYIIPQTGETISGTRGRELERKMASQKSSYSAKTREFIQKEYMIKPHEYTEYYVDKRLVKAVEKGQVGDLDKISIDNFYNLINQHLPLKFIVKLEQKMKEVIEKYGYRRIGQALNNLGYDVIEGLSRGKYDSDTYVRVYFSDVINSLPFLSDEEKEEAEDFFDEVQV